MRIYMMEGFLERIAVSAYRDSFIIKGGILVTSLVGISMRSTMDIDTSIKGQKLSLENAKNIINEIIEVELEDGVSFEVKDAETIMDEMEYPGIRFHIDALFEKMVTPIKIDISTGDVITPSAIEYHYTLILEDRKINLWSYNLETILAEKTANHTGSRTSKYKNEGFLRYICIAGKIQCGNKYRYFQKSI